MTSTLTPIATRAPVLAVVFSADHELGARVAQLHPLLRLGRLHRLPGTTPGPLRDRDALLCLAGAPATVTGPRPQVTVYLSTGDDPDGGTRDAEMHADLVLDPDTREGAAALRALLAHHLGATA